MLFMFPVRCLLFTTILQYKTQTLTLCEYCCTGNGQRTYGNENRCERQVKRNISYSVEEQNFISSSRGRRLKTIRHADWLASYCDVACDGCFCFFLMGPSNLIVIAWKINRFLTKWKATSKQEKKGALKREYEFLDRDKFSQVIICKVFKVVLHVMIRLWMEWENGFKFKTL